MTLPSMYSLDNHLAFAAPNAPLISLDMYCLTRILILPRILVTLIS